MDNGASSQSQEDSAKILFEQFPHEINMIILNLLDAETLLKTSGTCKRWLNNTKYLEHLRLCLTRKSILETVGNSRFMKRPRRQLAKINWQPLDATLHRFNPERLRSLSFHPDLQQNNDIVNNFVSRATNITKLTLYSVHYMDAVLKLPQEHLKEISLGITFDERLTRFTNLERLRFFVRHSHYEQQNIQQIAKFKHLKALSIHGAAQTYIDLEQVAQLNNLKELHLDYAYFTDDQFAVLSRLTNLEKLEMPYLRKEIPTDDSQLDMSEVIMPEIGNDNPVRGLRHLTNLVNLTYLDISNVQRTYRWGNGNVQEGYDIADLVLNHFSKLKTINISGTKLSKAQREKLKAISWLSVIDVKDRLGLGDSDEDNE